MQQRVLGQVARITLPSLGGHDDVFCEKLPCGRTISFFGNWRSAGLKLCPCVIEGGNQNLDFLRQKDRVGMLLDKAEHRVARIERSGPPRRELTTKSEQHVSYARFSSRDPAVVNHKVIAVKLDQVKGVEEHAPVIAPVAQPVEYRQAVVITGHGLTVDQA
jgi:hypothetical protein